MTRIARCACGALTATAEGDPVGQGVCSCTDCQWRTGSVIGVAAVFPEDRVAVAGPSRTWSRSNGESGTTTTFHFCPTCGSTVYWKPGWRDGVLLVAVGCFADKAFPVPKIAVYGERRPAWVCLSDTIEET
jgi:hypothetical protein